MRSHSERNYDKGCLLEIQDFPGKIDAFLVEFWAIWRK